MVTFGPVTDGTLTEYPFPRVLHLLSLAGLTGVLSVSHGIVEKRVFLRRGVVVFAASNKAEDYLSSVLIREKVLKDSVHQQAEEIFLAQEDEMKRMGQILIDIGALNPSDLEKYIHVQLLKIIYSLFTFKEGEFHFIEVDIPDEEIELQQPTGDLIIEGIRALKEDVDLLHLLPAPEKFVSVTRDPQVKYQAIRLNADEQKLLEAVDGTQTISQLLELRSFHRIDIIRALCGLICTGLLEVRDSAPSEFDIADVVGSELEEIIMYDLSDESKTFLEHDIAEKADFCIEGDLSSDFLPQLLLDLWKQKKTGILTCCRDSITKNVYLHKGQIIFAKSDSPFDQLIPLMQVGGKLTEDQATRAMNLWKTRQSDWQGTILMELGFLDFDALDWPLHFQLKEIITDLFSWDEGTVQFLEGSLPETSFVEAELSFYDLFIDGIRRQGTSTNIVSHLPSTETIFTFTSHQSPPLKKLPFTTAEMKACNLIDGKKSLAKIAEISVIDEPTLQICALILHLLGYITPVMMEVPLQEADTSVTTQLEGESTFSSIVGEHVNKVMTVPPEVRKSIDDFYAIIKSTDDPYTMLKVPRNFTTEQLSLNYHSLVKEFHPDKLVDYGDKDYLIKVQEIYHRVKEAYSILSDPEARSLFDGEAAIEPHAEDVEDQSILIEAEGDDALAQGKWDEALQFYKSVLKLIPDHADAIAKMAFIMAFSYGKYRDAKKLCRQAIELDKENATMHTLMASICRTSGLRIVAQQAINQAKILEEDNAFTEWEEWCLQQKIKKHPFDDLKKMASLLIDNI